ncbi:MAG: hypothetical protein GQ569_05135 [Methylococcaceae bacterium]|nr:hypothetical protein [Methylococcaceae bacterium]
MQAMTQIDLLSLPEAERTLLSEQNQQKIKEHQAWKTLIENNKKRNIYVDPSIDLSALADEVNDMEI